MTKTIAIAYNTVHEHRVRITSSLLAASAVLIVAYAMSVYAVVSHTVAIQKAQSDEVALSGAVQSLDSRYLELSSAITPDTLNRYGYVQGKVSAYISRTPSLGTVAKGGHEL